MKRNKAIVTRGELLAAVGEQAVGAIEGWAWEVIIMRPGLSQTVDPNSGLPVDFDAQFIRADYQAFSGAHVFANHNFDGRRLVETWVGTIEQPSVRADGAMIGRLDLLRETGTDWLREKLMAAKESSRLDKLGLSVQFYYRSAERGKLGGKAVSRPRGVIADAPISVDVVMFPAAGGAFLHAVAGLDDSDPESQDLGTQVSDLRSQVNSLVAVATQGAKMKERILKMLAALRKLASGDTTTLGRIDAVQASVDAQDANLDEALDRAADLLAAIPTGARLDAGGAVVAAAAAAAGEVAALRAEVQTVRSELTAARQAGEAAQARLRLNEALTASRLPAPLQADIRRRYPEGTAPTAEQITAEITAVREAYAAVVDSPTRLSAAPLIQAGYTSGEKMLIGLKRMFGITHEIEEKRRNNLICAERGAALDTAIPEFRGILEAYIALTGDRDMRGVADPEYIRGLAITAEFKTASFPYLMTNVVGALLLQEFAAGDGSGVFTPEKMRLLAIEGAVPNYKTQERPRFGMFANLDKIDPQATDYPELAVPVEQKVTFAMEGYGDILPISRRFILGDDLGAIQEIIRNFGWSAGRTLLQAFTTLFTANAVVSYDAFAWFESAHHLNLGATALTLAEQVVIRAAFRAFTYLTSGEKIGLAPRYWMVPTDLETQALLVNKTAYLSNSLADPSTVQHMLGKDEENPEGLIVNHLLTDANNYYVCGDKNRKPFVGIAYLNGRREPDVQIADNPAEGVMFTGDWLRYRIRYEFVPYVIDHRNVMAEIVAGP
jgi:hypothetical protein